mgnify:CR=1 FL=1
MELDDFIANVLAFPPSEVANVLASNLARFAPDASELHWRLTGHEPSLFQQRFRHERPTTAAAVAIYWLEAAVLTDGAFRNAASETVAFTPFGAAVLARLSLIGPADVEDNPPLSDEAMPVNEELERFAAVVQHKLRSSQFPIAQLFILGKVVRIVIGAIDVELDRSALDEAAGVLIDKLRAALDPKGMEEVQSDIRAEVAAIETAVAACRRIKTEMARGAVVELQRSVVPEASPDPLVAERLVELSKTLAQEGRYEEARSSLRAAIDLYRALATGDTRFQGQLARACQLLGSSYLPRAMPLLETAFSNLGSPDEFRSAIEEAGRELKPATPLLEEAISIFQRLAKDDLATYRTRLAQTLGALALAALIVRRDASSAETMLEEAIGHFEAATDTDSTVADQLTSAKMMRGMVKQASLIFEHMASGPALRSDSSAAERIAGVVDDMRQLSVEDPVVALQIAWSLVAKGQALAQQDQYGEARDVLREACDNYRDLLSRRPEAGSGLLWALGTYASVLSELGVTSEIVDVAREIAQRSRELDEAKETGTETQVPRAWALFYAGRALTKLRIKEEMALSLLADAASIARVLTKENSRHRDLLGQALLMLGIVLSMLNRESEMLHVHEEAEQNGVPIFSEWFPHKRPSWQLLARMFYGFADPTYLSRAVDAAAETEEDVQLLLRALRDRTPELAPLARLPRLVTQLQEEGRDEEALTVHLLVCVLTTPAMADSEQWSAEEQAQLLEVMLEALDRGVKLSEQLNDEPCRTHFLVYRATARLMSPAAEHSVAIEELKEAIDAYRSLAKIDPFFKSPLAHTLGNLGAAYGRRHEPHLADAAFDALREAVGLWRELVADDPKCCMELCGALLNQGLAYVDLGNTGGAFDVDQVKEQKAFERMIVGASPRTAQVMAFGALGEALNLTHDLDEVEPRARVLRVDILLNMAAVAWLHDEPTTARTLCDDAIRQYRAFGADRAVYRAGTAVRLFRLSAELHQEAAERTPDAPGYVLGLRKAVDDLEESAQALEQLLDVSFERTEAALLEQYGDRFDQLVVLHLRLAAQAEAAGDRGEAAARYRQAYLAAERGKGRRQAAMLAGCAVLPQEETAQKLAPEIERLRQELAALYRRLEADAASPEGQPLGRLEPARRAELEGEADQTWQRLHASLEQLARSDPQFASIRAFAPPQPPEAVVEALPRGGALVLLYPLPDSIACFVLRSKEWSGVDGVEADLRAVQIAVQIEMPRQHQSERAEALDKITLLGTEALASLVGHVLSGGGPATNDDLDVALRRLGWWLYPALAPLLPPPSPDRPPSLVLVPTGPLHRLPLHALPWPRPSTRLLDRYVVSYASSADVVVLARQKPAVGTGLVALAPGLAEQPGDPEPAGTLALAAAVGRASGGATYLREEATIGRLLDEHVAAGVRWALFATHGVAGGPSSGLLLHAGTHHEGVWLTAAEILARLDLAGVEHLLLAACSTHADDPEAGDRLAGLVRAFLYRGARSVQATLWRVYDPVAALIGLWTLEALLHGEPDKAKALRQAVQRLRVWTGLQAAATFRALAAALPEGDPAARQVLAWAADLELVPVTERPFQATEMWSPFVLHGAPICAAA